MNPIRTLLLLTLTTATTAQSPCALVIDTYAGATGSRVRRLTPAFGGSLLFNAQSATGWGLYRTWGNGQVQLLQTLPAADEHLLECSTPQGSRVYFIARDATYGQELHCTDGTPAGTRMIKDIRPGALGAAFGLFTRFGERMIFWCSDYQVGSEPYITDGTAAGTFRLKDINPGRGHGTPRDFTVAGDYALFVATDGTTGLELYVTDGTQAGTSLLKDISPTTSGYPKNLTRLGDKVLFSAYTAATGRELWVSDGTSAGTQLLRDIFPGTSDSHPGQFVEMGGKLYFGAIDGSHGHELWETDGTANGTKMVVDLFPGNHSADVTYLTVADEKLYFSANYRFGRGLPFCSDGTAAGTIPLSGSHQTYPPRSPREFVAAAGKVFFRANGRLWVSDGTTTGTRVTRTLASGGPNNAALITAVGDGVCFRASDAAAGWEMWFSDGTAAGTVRLCDLHPGSTGSYPQEIATAGGRVFFSTTTPTTGLEVFSLQNPGATVHRLPGASEPHRPTLAIADSQTPILGRSLQVEGSGPAGHLGFLIVGLPTDVARPAVPGLLAQGVDWVGALTPNSLIAATTVTSKLTLPLTVPNTTALDGDRVNLQAWWIAPGPLQFQVSNGLQLRLGIGAPR